jgi:hypothetical protein
MDLLLDMMVKVVMINKKPLNHAVKGRENNNDSCSTYIDSDGVILKGECDNKSTHNSFVRVFGINSKEPKGILETSHKKHVNSIEEVVFDNQQFIFTSGDDDFLNIFDIKSVKSGKIESKMI